MGDVISSCWFDYFSCNFYFDASCSPPTSMLVDWFTLDIQTSVSTVKTLMLLMLLLYRELQFCFLDSGVTKIPSSKSIISEHESDKESLFFLVCPVSREIHSQFIAPYLY